MADINFFDPKRMARFEQEERARQAAARQQNARPAQQQSTQPVQKQIGRTPSIDEFVAIYATKRPSGPDTSSPTDYAAAYKRRNALSANIRRLESEKTTRSQIWENGIYMGEDSAAAADYDRRIAALRKQMDALPKISAWERTKNAVAGGSGQWASGQVSAAGTVAGNIDSIGSEQTLQKYKEAVRYRDSLKEDIAAAEAGTYKISERGLANLREQLKYYDEQLIPSLGGGVRAYNTLAKKSGAEADRLSERSAEKLERAKLGLGWGGRLAVDVLVQGTQMALDRATGAPSASMFTRSMGAGAQEARQNGADAQKQIAYGAASGMVEVLTEKMFDGLAGLYGKGAADELVEAAIAKAAQTREGQAALRYLAGFSGEALEEIVADFVNPMIRTIYSGKSAREEYDKERLSDWLYDGLVGGIMGTAGTAVNRSTYKLNTQAEGQNAVTGETEKLNRKEEAKTLRGDSESTAVNTNPAIHTPKEQAVVNEYQDAVDDDLVNYIEIVRDNHGAKIGRYPLKPVSKRAAADIKVLTGVDVSGNRTEIEPRIIAHILKEHGAEGTTDQSMRDINDIARIQYVLDNYDDVVPAGSSAAYQTIKPNGKPGQAKTVAFSKAVNGTYYVVEAVPDTKAKIIFVVSAYMAKKETGLPPVNAEALRETPKSAAVKPVSEASSPKEVQTADTKAPALTANTENVSSSANGASASAASIRAEEGKVNGKRFFADAQNDRGVGAQNDRGVGAQNDGVRDAQNDSGLPTQPVTLDSIAAKYGAQAQAVRATYDEGQDLTLFESAYDMAWNYGKAGVTLDYAMKSPVTAYLTEQQRELAYKTGRAAAEAEAKARGDEIKRGEKGKTGWKKGVVKGENVTGNDLQKAFNLNSTQVRAYNILRTVAEATGIDIVLYKSEAGEDGEYQGAQGKYRRSEPGTIYIDINAGLSNIKSATDLQKYVMLRTFSHEFSHFVENWNPMQYNEFRSLVFNTIDQRRSDGDFSSDDLISLKMDQNPGMNYEAASREVVAEALTDILPDSNFVQNLADHHKTIFDKLLEKLKEFASRVREYFNSIGQNPSREARALKEQVGESVKYVDNIVKMFDEIAVKAVENYQSNYAVEEVTQESVNEEVSREVKEEVKENDEQEQSRAYLSDEAEIFREDIDNWDRSGRPDGDKFILGSTGDVLQGLGAIESDIYMLSDKINTILTVHPEMTLEEIKKIPQILENPILILKSRNVGREAYANSRIVMFGTVKAKNGLPVLSVLDLKPIEDHLVIDDMQKVSSAYTKDNNPVGYVSNSDVMYADEKRTTKLLRAIGFQMPIALHQSGYVGNISYERDIVNISGVPFSSVVKETEEQNQQRTSTLTDREALQYAASEIHMEDLTDGEKDALRIFNERLSKLEALQESRAEYGRIYKEQQFGTNVDRNAASATLNRMHVLDEQIKRASDAVLSVEDKTVLKRVLHKARIVVEKQERARGQEALRHWRDQRDNAAAIKKYREQIRADVDELTKWVLHPSNKDLVKHVPDALKDSVIPFISSINFMSKRSLAGGDATIADKEFMKKLRSLNSALKQNQDIQGLYSGYNDLPPDFMDRLQTFIDSAQAIVDNNSGEFVINKMTSEELQELSRVVRTLKKYIMEMNRFHANAMFQHVTEAGESSIDFMKEMRPAGNTGTVSNFLLWQQMRPAYAFERFGRGGKAIYDGLRRGQGTLAFNTRKITDFAKKAYTPEEVKAWEKEVKDLDLGGDHVRMTVAQMMSLYELSKRPQALGHILGRGVRVATFTQTVKGRTEKISDIGHELAAQDISTITNALTERQKAVADNLQKFMAEQGGKWGNHVSVARFGEELFTEEHYFPIHSDGRHLQATADENPSAASLYALLNMSFTKELTEEANNRIILYSIFDVFSNHMASMAQYNALALPVLDALKWFNYKSESIDEIIDENGKKAIKKTMLGSVRDEMARAYGTPEETGPGKGRQSYAESFVMNILKGFNGTEAQGAKEDTLIVNSLHQFNVSKVAFNVRVLVQQPTAIARAATVLKLEDIMRGLKMSPKDLKANIAEMQERSGIAVWKELGFYDVNISRGVTHLIKQDDTLLDKVNEVGLKGAEFMDRITWAAIWSASKEAAARQGVRRGSEAFYTRATEIFEEVIYKTQVVDSILTKNEWLRSRSAGARLTSSFMGEPTTTVSMLMDAYDKYAMDMRRGYNRTQAWRRNSGKIASTALAFGLSAILLAIATAPIDAGRDDDEYQTFLEKYLEAFKNNFFKELDPLSKLPVVSDFVDAAKLTLNYFGVDEIFGLDIYGYEPNLIYMNWLKALEKAGRGFQSLREGKPGYTEYYVIYNVLDAASGITGLPMATATRELISAWNNIIGAMAPSLKVKSYDPGDKNEIKYAYKDGNLTAEEAEKLLVSKELVEDGNEAYWLLQSWADEDGDYSRYDKLYEAVRSGGDVQRAMQELTRHGYTRKELISQIKTQIGNWYRGTDEEPSSISRAEARRLLLRYTDTKKEDVDALLNEWSAKVVTGIAFGDIGKAYLEGEISSYRAIQMWKLYGGLTDEEAKAKLTAIKFRERNPDVDWADGTINSYISELQPTGISIDVFDDYITGSSKCTGTDKDGDGKADRNSVKDQKLLLIDSLSISNTQKDALYRYEGWAESNLRKAPWH